jgi:6-phosphogluconolactonase
MAIVATAGSGTAAAGTTAVPAATARTAGAARVRAVTVRRALHTVLTARAVRAATVRRAARAVLAAGPVRRRAPAVTAGPGTAAGATAGATATAGPVVVRRGGGHEAGGGGPVPPTAAAPAVPPAGEDRAQSPRPLYVGAYTQGGAEGGAAGGIGLAAYDPVSGALTARGTVTGVADPSFLALTPSGHRLYAVDEQPRGAVTVVAMDGDGGPRVLGAQETGGAAPCHLCVHPGGRHVLAANYASGSIAVFPLDDDGALLPRSALVRHTGSGPDRDRQEGPHVHMVTTDPDGRFVLAVDLGTDAVYTYRLAEAAGTLEAVSRAAVPPGTGPRHLAFHPSGRYAYLVAELGDSVTVCGYDPATGTLTPGAAQPTVPPDDRRPGRNYPAEILVSPGGDFVYVSNRGHDSVARFAVTGGGAGLRLLDAVPSGGAYPRHIALTPSGTLLLAAHQNSGTVTAFHVDRRSGALTPAGGGLTTPSPVCVVPR